MTSIGTICKQYWPGTALLLGLLCAVIIPFGVASATNMPRAFFDFIDSASSPKQGDAVQADALFFTHLTSIRTQCSNSASYKNGEVIGFDGGEAFDSLLAWGELKGQDLDDEFIDKSWALISKLKGELDGGMSLEYNSSTDSQGWCAYIVKMADDSGILITGTPVEVDRERERKSALIAVVARDCTAAFGEVSNGVIAVPTQITTFLNGLSDSDFRTNVETRRDALMTGGADSAACGELALALSAQLDVGSEEFCRETPDAPGCEGEGSGSNCNVEGGLGWILCPLLNTMAGVNDAAFGQIQKFLATPPINTDTRDQTNGVYIGWTYMRNIANAAFVIVFMYIIFSQVSSIGVSNYGIKKMLPKLIIGAILVNTSFWITAIAVDISNVLGSSVYNIFGGLAERIPVGDASGGGISWVSVTTMVLIGGAIAVMVGLSVLLPLAVSAAAMLLGIFFTLVFRHAMVIVLIIAAPLAFVAYLLPNTEKLFKSWWSLLRILLLIYPIIAFVFAVSQLASRVVYSAAANTTDDGQDVALMIVAVAMPAMAILLIPALIKVTGGVLGKFGFANPLGGAINSIKSRAKDQGERSDRRASNSNKWYAGGRMKFGQGRRDRRDFRNKMKDDALTNTMQAQTLGTWRGKRAYRQQGAAQQTLASAKSKAEIDELKYNKELHLNATVDNLRLDAAKTQFQAEFDKEKATSGTAASQAALDQFVASQSSASSNRITSQNTATALADSEKLQSAAAGADGRYGAERAKAGANQTLSKLFDDNVTAEKTTMTSDGVDALITTMQDSSQSSERRAAAAGMLMNRGGDQHVQQALDYVAANHSQEGMSDIQMQMAADIGNRKPVGYGATAMSSLASGKLKTRYNDSLVDRIQAGKIGSSELMSMGSDELMRLAQVANERPDDISNEHMAKLEKAMADIKDKPELNARMTEERAELFKAIINRQPEAANRNLTKPSLHDRSPS